MLLLSDNWLSIGLVYNLVLHEKTKYMEIYYHFVYVKLAEGQIEMSYIPKSIQHIYLQSHLQHIGTPASKKR